jgi:predicted RecB family nuclease
VDAEQVVVRGFDEQMAELVAKMAAIPGITREQADALVHAGIARLEDLLQAEAGDLADIPNIGDAAAILDAAKAEASRRSLPVGN